MISYRIVTEEDAEAYLEFFRKVVSETDNLACSPEDAEKMTVEDERDFIKAAAASGSVSVAAFDKDTILGSCDIRISARKRLRHRGEMGIAVRRECWGSEVAGRILSLALAEARKRGVRKIDLTVRSDNERAKAFYKKNGFGYAGSDRMLFCIDGEYVDGERYELILS